MPQISTEPMLRETSGARRRLIVAGPPRSGTTVLAAVLSQLGVQFGVEDRAWDVEAGHYEHAQLLAAYSTLRKAQRLAWWSDNAEAVLRGQAARGLGRLLHAVSALKYPPLSPVLPSLVRQAGYVPLLAVSLRRFEGYALSRMRKGEADHRSCRSDYLNIYATALGHLHLYGGVVLCYEDLFSEARKRWLPPLMALTGADADQVETVLTQAVQPARSQISELLSDPACDELYRRLNQKNTWELPYQPPIEKGL